MPKPAAIGIIDGFFESVPSVWHKEILYAIHAGIPVFEAALKEAGKTYELHMYPGVNHAFNNDTSAARYDKAAADLAWKRTVEFLKTHLA